MSESPSKVANEVQWWSVRYHKRSAQKDSEHYCRGLRELAASSPPWITDAVQVDYENGVRLWGGVYSSERLVQY